MATVYRSRALIGRGGRRSAITTAVLAASVTPVLRTSDALAVTKVFSAANQAWLTTTNWTPNGLPLATDDILIDSGVIEMTLSNGAIPAQYIVYSNYQNRAIGNATGGAGNSTITLHGSGATPLISVTNAGTFNIKGPNSSTGTGTLGVVLNASGQFSVTGTGGLTIGAVISETGEARAIEKVGSGLLTLTGVNTFTGDFSVRDGTVSINSITNAGIAQPLGMSAGFINLGSATTSGFITYTGASATTDRMFNKANGGGGITTTNNLTLTGDSSGPGAFTKAGAGALILSGANGRLGGPGLITISGGSLQLDNNTNKDDRISAPVTMNHGTFAFIGNTNLGTVTAENAGALTIAAGGNKVSTESVGTLSGVATVTFGSFARTGGTVDFDYIGGNGTNVVFGSAPTLDDGILGGYATFIGNDWATDVGGGVVGAYSSYFNGEVGSWTAGTNADLPAGASTIAASTTVNTIRFNDAAQTLTIDPGQTLTVDAGGVLATTLVAAGQINGSGSITAGAGNELIVHASSSANLTIAAPIANNAGTVKLLKAGPGALVLDAANTFTGSADVLGGTLRMGASGTLATNTVNVFSGATFDLNSQTKSIGGLSGAGAVTLGSGTLSFGANGTNTTHSGVISGTGSIIKAGAATTALTGVNTFTGTTSVGPTDASPGGTLVVDADSRFGAAPGAATPGKINIYNGTLRLTGGNGITSVATSMGVAGFRGVLVSINRGVALGSGNGAIEVPTNEYAEIPGIIADAGGGTSPLRKIGGGTLDLRTAINTFTGGVIVDGGSIGITRDQNLGAIPGGTNFAAVQLNNGATLKWYSNTGTTGLAATRGVTIGAGGGGFELNFSSNFPVFSMPITSAVGNTFTKTGTSTAQMNVNQPTMNGDLVIGQGRWNTHANQAAGTGTIYLSAPDNSPATAAGTAQLGIGGTNLGLNITLANNIVLSPNGQGINSIEVNNSTPTQNTLTLNGAISGTGGLTKGRVAGTSGNLVLGGNNTYTGETTVLLGSVEISSNNNLGNAANGVTLGGSGSAATLKLGANVTGARTITTASGGGVVDTNGFNGTFGNAAGTANFVKNSLGSLTINHARVNNLTVNAGTLAMAPNAAAAGTSKVSTLTIAAGAKLDLGQNKLITTSALGTESGGVYGGVQGMVQSASNFGAWDGNGLTTSEPDAAGGLTSIGVATGGQILGLGPTDTALFGGQTMSGASTVAMYTYAGDANLDGFISGDDYAAIDFNIAVPGSDGWYNGDFNWDGIISGDDYAAIDFNIVAQGAPFPTGGSAGLRGVTAVPEPASLGVIGLVTAAVTARRRRRS